MVLRALWSDDAAPEIPSAFNPEGFVSPDKRKNRISAV